MRARTYLLASMASLGVLGVGIGAGVEGQILAQPQESTANAASSTSSSSTASNSASTSVTDDSTSDTAASSSTPSESTSTAASASASSSGLKDGTYTGSAASTRYGDVQVQIKVSGGKVTSSNAVEYPTQDGRDQQINSYAVPILNSEVTEAQSASISQVSGATFTSGGYITSLQSALEEAQA